MMKQKTTYREIQKIFQSIYDHIVTYETWDGKSSVFACSLFSKHIIEFSEPDAIRWSLYVSKIGLFNQYGLKYFNSKISAEMYKAFLFQIDQEIEKNIIDVLMQYKHNPLELLANDGKYHALKYETRVP